MNLSRRTIATVGAITACGVCASSPAAALPPGCSQSGQTATCTYTSGSKPFSVPAGVSSLHVVAVGGKGGNGVGGLSDSFTIGTKGGFGAVVSGDIPVQPGTTVYAVVGGNGMAGGAAGANGGGGGGRLDLDEFVVDPGGGGGGASDLRSSLDDLASRLLVAAGGGGGGGDSELQTPGGCAPCFTPGGAGGAGGSGNGVGGTGGGGGGGLGSGTTGGSGGAGCPSPGACNFNGATGANGFGGNGGAATLSGIAILHEVIAGGGGGGGGGGLFGGGGGGGGFGPGGGGGGGSNLVPPGGSQAVDATGNPMVQISYLLPPTSKDQCKDGGWRSFALFKNQGDCVSFVNTGR